MRGPPLHVIEVWLLRQATGSHFLMPTISGCHIDLLFSVLPLRDNLRYPFGAAKLPNSRNPMVCLP